jgi:hypothetical protein
MMMVVLDMVILPGLLFQDRQSSDPNLGRLAVLIFDLGGITFGDVSFFALHLGNGCVQVGLHLVHTLEGFVRQRSQFGLQSTQVFVSRGPEIGPQFLAALRRKQQGDDGADGRT